MSFFNYFADSERSAAGRATDIKNKLFGSLGPLLARLHIPPDAVSYMGLACLTGVVIWFISHPYRAVALIVLYVIIDGIDGSYARYLNRPTQAGAFTDIVVDQLGMVVITLGFLQYGMVDGPVGAYYIMIYLLMIAFSVVQNAQGIPLQYIFRTKYILYGIYALWAFTKINPAPVLLPVFSLIMTVSVVQSYLRLKRGFYWKYDLPKLLIQDHRIRAEGGKPPAFWPIMNFVLPAALVALLLFLGAYTQINGMVEMADVTPAWEKVGPLPLLDDSEEPRSVAAYKDGWLLSSHISETGLSRVYHLDRSFNLLETFRVPWALDKQHGAATDDDNRLFIADRHSRRVFDINIAVSIERGIAALERSFDTTLRAPSACVLVKRNGQSRMLVTEYMAHYKTLLIDHEKAFREGTAENAIAGWYRNMGFSRGIASDGRRIYELNSSLWKDIIYAADLETALAERYLSRAAVKEFEASRWHCRDIAVNGNTLVLVDPGSKDLFAAPLPAGFIRKPFLPIQI